MMAYNGVIETATGNLLRAGFCDFETDGAFDGLNEDQRTDIPFPGQTVSGNHFDQKHRWNGSAWVLIDK